MLSHAVCASRRRRSSVVVVAVVVVVVVVDEVVVVVIVAVLVLVAVGEILDLIFGLSWSITRLWGFQCASTQTLC